MRTIIDAVLCEKLDEALTRKPHRLEPEAMPKGRSATRAFPVSAFRAVGLKPARFLAVRCIVKGGRPGIRKRELL
ncbi:MAG: hypothetical protein IIC51_11860 [Planctomycetes bacterium]|nr:hypothetical protein [Planctomycetota bacterium]